MFLEVTLPETNSSHLKIDGWKWLEDDPFLVGKPFFQGLWLLDLLVLGSVDFLKKQGSSAKSAFGKMNVLFPCWSFAVTLKLHQSCSWKSHSKHPVAKSEKQNAIMGHSYIYIYTVYIIVYIQYS